MPKQHQSKGTMRLLKLLESMDFVVHTKTKSGSIKIEPPASIGGGPYFTHGTESAYHQMIRDFRKKYNVDLKTQEVHHR